MWKYIQFSHCSKITNNQPKQVYIGASARKTVKRLKEHEHAIRCFNDRTTPGEHMMQKHLNDKPRKIEKKINIQNMLNQFHIEIVKKCKNPLDTYLSEALEIKKGTSNMNNMSGNGFIR